MKKESILLYANQWGALARLTDGQLGCLFRSIFLWLNDREVDLETLEPPLQIAFQFMTLQISIDCEKYLQSKRRIQKKKEAKTKDENVNSVNDLNSITRTRGNVDVDVDVDDDVSKKEEKKESKEEKIQNFVKYWNSCIDSTDSRMKKIKAITPERKAKIEIIMKTFPAESAAQAIANAMRSPYCNGETQRRLKPVDFDWLMRLDNFTKALEGAL